MPSGMPEGDTLFRAARVVRHALKDHTITRYEARAPALTHVDLLGAVARRVDAYGKYLFIAFEGRGVLVTHLKMIGSWHVYPAARSSDEWGKPASRARVVLGTDRAVAVCFSAPVVRWMTEGAARELVASLGPDILADDFDVRDVVRRLRTRNDWTIAEALLDQTILAGIGNIYKSEVLFVTATHPMVVVGALSDDALQHIVTRARQLMLRNVPETVGRRVTNAASPSGLWVYGRAGQPCFRCRSRIELFTQGGAQAHRVTLARTTYCCPRCQSRPAVRSPFG
jgi:endonuclease-8